MLINHTLACLDDVVLLAYGGGNCFSFGTHFNRHTLAIHGLAAQQMPMQPALATTIGAELQLRMSDADGQALLSKRQPFLVQGRQAYPSKGGWS